MKVIVATKNPGKIEGARRALAHYFGDFEIEGFHAESNVPDQPVNQDIYLGAKNRIKNVKAYCRENNINADLFMSIESGIQNLFGEWQITNVAVIEDTKGFSSCGLSQSFPVPERLVDDIIKTDLGTVMNNIYSKDDERGKKGGGIQLLTKDKVSRIDITESAFVMALVKYINEEWK